MRRESAALVRTSDVEWPLARAVLLAGSLAISTAPASAQADPEGPAYGDISTFAALPAEPGFPEGIVVSRGRVFVSGPATDGTAGTGPSEIAVFNRGTGEPLASIEVAGEVTGFEHALSCAAEDLRGRIYVATAQLFAPPFAQLGIQRFRQQQDGTYVQEAYSEPFVNLPSCVLGPLPVSCALPNDLAFVPDGRLLVTDSFQGAIWEVPPGGGTPKVWLQSDLLLGGGFLPIGVNGLRIGPDREYVYFSVTFSAADPGIGYIYRVPLSDEPQESDIEVFHVYGAGEGPDGFAFGHSGDLYVALAGSNEISVLDATGAEVGRIASDVGDDTPLDAPANIAFNGPKRSLLVTNHASISGNVDNFAVLDVFVNDRASPLIRPWLP